MTPPSDADDRSTPTLLVAGTASHVGKSTVAAGLCRYFADRGVDVAPFKAQNMSNNARAVPKAATDGRDDGGAYGEIGVSQYVQARAARRPASTDHNPVLLKPRGGGESQLVLQGEAVAHYAADEYYERYWDRARETAVESYERLAANSDLVVAEGAGGLGEINLHHRDLANVETARFADAAVLLVADIERGGAFASLVGTLELVPDDLRERVVGCLITKFRGDRSILEPGLEEFEDRTGVPIVGVLPYDDPGLPEEDSVSLPAEGERSVRGSSGASDGVDDDRAITVAVPRLPRISNFTDLEPLAAEPGVRVSYRPLDAEYGDAAAIVVPGTKNTVDDLLAVREAGFDGALRAFDGPIVGLCGGYQLLGERITGADVEGTGDRSTVEGVGLLPVETAFSPEKSVERVERELRGVGPLAGASDTVTGYEIHAGETTIVGPADRPFEGRGAATDDVFGTYLHGLFENSAARDAFVDAAFAAAGRERPPSDAATAASDSYDRAAALIDECVDVSLIVRSIDGVAATDPRVRKF